ncbi:epoxide hydrolase family protein [Amycolatopsis albispora]|uniref:epoxide hydrolase family protein n=1 Tax=Amycolatopsis albispora TaxID=1804986 RepID=UPI000DE512A4
MIRPFRIDIPQTALDALADRLENALLPNEIPGTGSAYGMPVDRVRELVRYWREEFDWRALEARLNAYPQFTTEIDGEDIHFLHVRSSREDATPLVLSHGWPGTILEYLDVIELLTEPADGPAFHLVIPSLPGFGFSGPTRSPGWNRYRTARAWAELMSRLGYQRYGAVGNDGGSLISPEIARIDPEHVIGVHVTQLFSFPSGDPAEMADLSEADQAALRHLQWFYDFSSTYPLTCIFAFESPLRPSPGRPRIIRRQTFASERRPC